MVPQTTRKSRKTTTHSLLQEDNRRAPMTVPCQRAGGAAARSRARWQSPPWHPVHLEPTKHHSSSQGNIFGLGARTPTFYKRKPHNLRENLTRPLKCQVSSNVPAPANPLNIYLLKFLFLSTLMDARHIKHTPLNNEP